MTDQEREALELDVVIALEDRFGHLQIPTYAWEAAVTKSIDTYRAALAAREDTEQPGEEDERAEVELRNLAEAVHRLNVDWERAAHNCGDKGCTGDCRYVREVQETLDRVLGTKRVRDTEQK